MTTTLKWVVLGAVLGFATATGVSCGPAKCTMANCAFGCCDATGACKTQTSDSQCGTSGNACTSCVLGQTCQLGICLSAGSGGGFGGGSGGGAQGGGSGGGAQGGGSGGGAQGGGSGGGAQGGGSGGGAQGGGTGGGSGGCAAFGTAYTNFMAGRSVCTNGSFTLNADPTLASRCSSGCTSTDQIGIQGAANCLAGAPTCTSGNENNALNAFASCTSDLASLTPACQSALTGSPPVGGGTGGGTPVGGGTGGGTPTGGGTGGGGTPSCTTITTFTSVRGAGAYDATQMMTAGTTANTSTDPTDILRLELWDLTATVPATTQLSATTYNTCPLCAILSRTCTTGTGGSCTGGTYLGRTGSMTVSAYPPAGSPGTFSASISSVRFEEWDMASDTAVPGGRCVNVTTGSMSVQVP